MACVWGLSPPPLVGLPPGVVLRGRWCPWEMVSVGGIGGMVSVCAVTRCLSSVGASPTRQLSLQPVAIGAAVEVTIAPKLSMERAGQRPREQAGRNRRERRAGLETFDVGADPALARGRPPSQAFGERNDPVLERNWCQFCFQTACGLKTELTPIVFFLASLFCGFFGVLLVQSQSSVFSIYTATRHNVFRRSNLASSNPVAYLATRTPAGKFFGRFVEFRSGRSTR
jgi:hypothetical protein